MRSEEKSIKAISAQAHGEAADNRLLRKKLREKDELISDLRAQIESLNRNLSEKVGQMADMMDKLVAFMMGRGDVTLLMSIFANIRNHKLDPVKYLCDVFRRIKNTANDKLVELLVHKWQPATVSAWV